MQRKQLQADHDQLSKDIEDIREERQKLTGEVESLTEQTTSDV